MYLAVLHLNIEARIRLPKLRSLDLPVNTLVLPSRLPNLATEVTNRITTLLHKVAPVSHRTTKLHLKLQRLALAYLVQSRIKLLLPSLRFTKHSRIVM